MKTSRLCNYFFHLNPKKKSKVCPSEQCLVVTYASIFNRKKYNLLQKSDCPIKIKFDYQINKSKYIYCLVQKHSPVHSCGKCLSVPRVISRAGQIRLTSLHPIPLSPFQSRMHKSWGGQITRTIDVLTVAPNICEFSVGTILHVTLQEPSILEYLRTALILVT